MTTVVDADLEAITRTIWGTLFELPLSVADAAAPLGPSTVTGIVHIDGAWAGAVVLRCPMALARMLTAAMFQTDLDPSDADVGDALGELVNMTAGNVKALLPEPCGISLPAVAFGRDYQLNVIGTAVVATAQLICAGHPLEVTLLHGTSGKDGP